VKTGEGKSWMVLMLAVLEHLCTGRCVDILTSQLLLARREATSSDIIKVLKLCAMEPPACVDQDDKYSHPLIFGHIFGFTVDMLRPTLRQRDANSDEMRIVLPESRNHKRGQAGRPFQVAIGDEIDSILLDFIFYSTQLSVSTPGYRPLNVVLRMIFEHLMGHMSDIGHALSVSENSVWVAPQNLDAANVFHVLASAVKEAATSTSATHNLSLIDAVCHLMMEALGKWRMQAKIATDTASLQSKPRAGKKRDLLHLLAKFEWTVEDLENPIDLRQRVENLGVYDFLALLAHPCMLNLNIAVFEAYKKQPTSANAKTATAPGAESADGNSENESADKTQNDHTGGIQNHKARFVAHIHNGSDSTEQPQLEDCDMVLLHVPYERVVLQMMNTAPLKKKLGDVVKDTILRWLNVEPPIDPPTRVLTKSAKKRLEKDSDAEITEKDYLPLTKQQKQRMQQHNRERRDRGVSSKEVGLDTPFLRDVVKANLSTWVDSAWRAIFHLHCDDHYCISDGKDVHCINKATGVTEPRRIFPDGTHQCLQIKHGLRMTVMGSTSKMITNYAFLKRYTGDGTSNTDCNNKMYGLSATLGDKPEVDYFDQHFYADVIRVPSFCVKDKIDYNAILCDSDADWKRSIQASVATQMRQGKAVLIIAENIAQARVINDYIEGGAPHSSPNVNGCSSLCKCSVQQKVQGDACGCCKKFPGVVANERVHQYWDSTDSDATDKLDKETFCCGSIIVATNLAGRGTDVRLCANCKRQGGLHVIVTFLPRNKRDAMQFLGRSARANDPGSTIFVLNRSRNNFSTASCRSITHMRNLRDMRVQRSIAARSERVSLQAFFPCTI